MWAMSYGSSSIAFACKCDIHRIFQCRNAVSSICHDHLSSLHIVKLHCGLAELLHNLWNPTSPTSCSLLFFSPEAITMKGQWRLPYFTRYFVNTSSILHDQSAFATIVHTWLWSCGQVLEFQNFHVVNYGIYGMK